MFIVIFPITVDPIIKVVCGSLSWLTMMLGVCMYLNFTQPICENDRNKYSNTILNIKIECQSEFYQIFLDKHYIASNWCNNGTKEIKYIKTYQKNNILGIKFSGEAVKNDKYTDTYCFFSF